LMLHRKKEIRRAQLTPIIPVFALSEVLAIISQALVLRRNIEIGNKSTRNAIDINI